MAKALQRRVHALWNMDNIVASMHGRQVAGCVEVTKKSRRGFQETQDFVQFDLIRKEIVSKTGNEIRCNCPDSATQISTVATKIRERVKMQGSMGCKIACE